MKIKNISVFNGANIYCLKPVIKIVVDIEELHNKTTKDIEGFTDTITTLIPTLEEHYCGVGYKGGFIDRLKEGTYFAHVLEHLILELQSLLGYEVYYGKTRLKENPSVYNVIFEFTNELAALGCVNKATDIIQKVINHQEVDINNILSELYKTKQENELGPSARSIYDEAKKRGIPVMRLGSDSILQLGYGKYSRLVQASMTDATSCIAVDISCNKQLTKQLLKENSIPVPHGYTAYSEDQAVAIANDIGYPVVLKPLNGNQGKGVVLDIQCDADVRDAYKIALAFSNAVIVEKFIHGNDYRVLVIGNKVSAVSQRIPALVIGDGKHTLKQLIDIENSNPLRGDDHEKPLTKIKLDNVTLNYLNKNNMDQDTVPTNGEIIRLRYNGNLSTGGTAIDYTKKIHPDNAHTAITAAKTIGLDIAGVDITTDDISKSIYESNGAVIEVNTAPGLRMHLYPSFGDKVNVAADILDMLYPEGTPCTIPIIALTGTNGKTTTARLLKHTLTLMGKKVGMTSTSGIYIGEECVLKGDNTGPFSTKVVLRNKEVEAAVLEVARGGIIKRGLGYELADVGLITNVSNDHIGLDEVESIEDLAFVKSLVVEAVKPNGCSVLNADDSMIKYFLKRAKGNIILFSKNHTNHILNEHIRQGGQALYIKDNNIVINKNNIEVSLISISDIPITFKGALECNIENSLSAASSLFALGVPLNYIKKGLSTFKPDINMNPGRFNIFEVGNIKVMLDYGHNQAGYEEVGKFVKKLGCRVIGVIGVPGDRNNQSIRQIGAISSNIFSKVYIKEDIDLRGRKPNEVADLLFEGLIGGGYKAEDIKVILSETKALEAAISEASDGDLVILFYEELDPAVKLVTQIQSNLKNYNLESQFDNVVRFPIGLTSTDIKIDDKIGHLEAFNEV